MGKSPAPVGIRPGTPGREAMWWGLVCLYGGVYGMCLVCLYEVWVAGVVSYVCDVSVYMA